MRPVVHGLDQRYGDRVAFVSIDHENRANAALLDRYRVRGYPTVVVLGASGELAKRFVGLTEVGTLETAIRQVAGE